MKYEYNKRRGEPVIIDMDPSAPCPLCDGALAPMSESMGQVPFACMDCGKRFIPAENLQVVHIGLAPRPRPGH